MSRSSRPSAERASQPERRCWISRRTHDAEHRKVWATSVEEPHSLYAFATAGR
jgi:hypothetical protein